MIYLEYTAASSVCFLKISSVKVFPITSFRTLNVTVNVLNCAGCCGMAQRLLYLEGR